MLDDEPTTDTTETGHGATDATGAAAPRRRRAASRPAGPPVLADTLAAAPQQVSGGGGESGPPAETAVVPAAKATRKRAARKSAAAPSVTPPAAAEDAAGPVETVPAEAPVRRTRKRAAKATAAPAVDSPGTVAPIDTVTTPAAEDDETPATVGFAAPSVLFQPPAPAPAPRRRSRAASQDTASQREAAVGEGARTELDEVAGATSADTEAGAEGEAGADGDEGAPEGDEGASRRRRRGGRGRRGRGRTRDDDLDAASAADEGAGVSAAEGEQAAAGEDQAGEAEPGEDEPGSRRRRRRRRRGGEGSGSEDATPDDPPQTVVRIREPRGRGRGADADDDGVRSVKGSTRLEAKKQRRREGREAGRRRPAIITEAEFLARREAVDRSMVVRQSGERTQIAVLEDGVLVEHYVGTASSTGLTGNVYLGKVQNVLPSMEAAFVDIGRGRNAVLYAGEVNWDAAGLEGQPRRIELALKSGDSVLVQVTKDPMGHKGARLTSQVSLAGRYLVYVPGGSMTGISRKLPDTERTRLKSILKRVVPEGAGVIVRTAAEGASEEALARDVARLTAQWEDIEKKSAKASAPALLYGEPDMTIRVVRDIFNEDFASLVVSGDDAWDVLEPYVAHVAPDLRDRMSRWTEDKDVFTAHRVDEQLAKALDRKVWLPSGGYLVIDRTEAMIVVDVNTGKFTGAGGNLEETVTKNNLEAAEEIVRQLRLRDLGGIIVIDFIDMVLESNRDLVLRRLLECLGRDRTKHQVAEVTSLGLVQMTRKRVGQGLHEVFAETCEACSGRGYHIHTEPVTRGGADNGGDGERRRGGRGGAKRGEGAASKPKPVPRPPAPATAPVPDGQEPSEPGTEAASGNGQAAAEVDQEAAPAPRRRARRAATSPVTTL